MNVTGFREISRVRKPSLHLWKLCMKLLILDLPELSGVKLSHVPRPLVLSALKIHLQFNGTGRGKVAFSYIFMHSLAV